MADIKSYLRFRGVFEIFDKVPRVKFCGSQYPALVSGHLDCPPSSFDSSAATINGNKKKKRKIELSRNIRVDTLLNQYITSC